MRYHCISVWSEVSWEVNMCESVLAVVIAGQLHPSVVSSTHQRPISFVIDVPCVRIYVPFSHAGAASD